MPENGFNDQNQDKIIPKTAIKSFVFYPLFQPNTTSGHLRQSGDINKQAIPNFGTACLKP